MYSYVKILKSQSQSQSQCVTGLLGKVKSQNVKGLIEGTMCQTTI